MTKAETETDTFGVDAGVGDEAGRYLNGSSRLAATAVLERIGLPSEDGMIGNDLHIGFVGARPRLGSFTR